VDTQDEQAEDQQADKLAALAEPALPESELTDPELPPDADFIVTKEHRRFTELALEEQRNGEWRYPHDRRAPCLLFVQPGPRSPTSPTGQTRTMTRP
jgi:hypothetical protein